MQRSITALSTLVLCLLAQACTHQRAPAAASTEQPPAAPATQSQQRPADAFVSALAKHCGKAYAGRIIANTPRPTTPDPFEGKALIMHVRDCSGLPDRLRIPFHVGADHSRTWVLTRVGDRLRLKHDHRHQDGSPDPVTLYGGDSIAAGTATRQEFPVDAESVTLFKAQGLAGSIHNTWAMQLDPTRRFVYELSRPDGRLFQVEFDLSKPVPLPPPPWGG